MKSASHRIVRLLPSTIFGRLAASLLLVVGVTLIVLVALVLRDRAELSLRVGSVSDSAHRIEALTRDYEALEPDARAAFIERLKVENAIRMEPESYPGRRLRQSEVDAIERAFVAEIRDRLGEGYEVTVDRIGRSSKDVVHLVTRRRSSHGTTALDVSLGLPGGGALMYRVAAPALDPPLPWHLLIQLGALTLVLAGVLFLVTRSITRPLSRLAGAADAMGRNVRHPPLPEEGVREIREVTRAFNAMQDRLLRYLDSRTSMLAAMSHDLRTPLTRLRLRAESVTDEHLRSRFASDLDEMEGMVHGALALFKGLNDDEAFERVDVGALVETLVTEYRETGSNVSVEGTARGATAAKPRALKRCLANLVDNALKFGKRAMIRIDHGPELVISVSDEGPGIPEEYMEQVFEPFYRLEVSRSRNTGGAGLGLSIARDVAQAHGGTLTLRNRPQGGLTAELRLPQR
jgi:signal transduction histidine kinase